MTLLVLSAGDLPGLLPYPEVVEVMGQALAALAAGHACQPVRTVLQPPGAAGLMVLMPCYLPPAGGAADEPGYGLKAICVSPGNPALGKDAHQGGVASESGDFLLAVADGAIGAGHIRAELGEVLAGRAPGRADDQEITVFESLGLAVEDFAAAVLAYRKALASGAGTRVDF